mmetsp:Transcript_24393/g.78679  ORF Transcript_24393/g.78679 Transcript_24393/m.78679 type:complete len:396 (+) Transcript_24393:211-1398(+)
MILLNRTAGMGVCSAVAPAACGPPATCTRSLCDIHEAALHRTLVSGSPSLSSSPIPTPPILTLRHDDGSVEAYDLVSLVTLDSLKALACSPIRPVRACAAILPHSAPSKLPSSSEEAQSMELLCATATAQQLPRLPFTDREPSNMSATSSSCPSTRSASGSDDEPDAASAAPRVTAARKRRRVQTKIAWTREEDAAIEQGVRKFGFKWARIAIMLPEGRTDDAVRNRWHRLQRKQQKRARHPTSCLDLNGTLMPPLVADGPSGPPEAVVSGEGTASSPPGEGGTKEAASQDDVDKHGDMWTAEEDRIIDHAVRFQDLRWKAIAALLPGRTESGCRNRWLRNQQRILTALGVPAKGTADVFAALRSRDGMHRLECPSRFLLCTPGDAAGGTGTSHA